MRLGLCQFWLFHHFFVDYDSGRNMYSCFANSCRFCATLSMKDSGLWRKQHHYFWLWDHACYDQDWCMLNTLLQSYTPVASNNGWSYCIHMYQIHLQSLISYFIPIFPRYITTVQYVSGVQKPYVWQNKNKLEELSLCHYREIGYKLFLKL